MRAVCVFVCSSVCVCVGLCVSISCEQKYLQKFCTDFDDIFGVMGRSPGTNRLDFGGYPIMHSFVLPQFFTPVRNFQ